MASEDTKEQAAAEDDKRAKHALKRQKAIEELVATEATYVTQLQLLLEHYANSLNDYKIIKEKEYHSIFPNDLRIICNLNSRLLNDLMDRIDENFDNDRTKISDILINFAPYFKMYQSYMNNHETAAKCLADVIENNKAFSKYIESQRKYFNNLNLTSLLILPVQRIPRYKIIVAEIVKNTESEHPDLDGLNKALDIIGSVNLTNNERLKDIDARSIVMKIESEMENLGNISLVTPSRIFVKQTNGEFENELYKVSDSQMKSIVFYLFNDCLIYATPPSGILGIKSKKTTFRMLLPFDSAFVIQDWPDTEKMQDCFVIKSTFESFMVKCETNKIKQDWIKEITKSLKEWQQTNAERGDRNNVNTPIQSNFEIPFIYNDSCMKCNNKIEKSKRLFCPNCGDLVCPNCYDNKGTMASKIDASAQVMICNDCQSRVSRFSRANPSLKRKSQNPGGQDLLDELRSKMNNKSLNKSSHVLGSLDLDRGSISRSAANHVNSPTGRTAPKYAPPKFGINGNNASGMASPPKLSKSKYQTMTDVTGMGQKKNRPPLPNKKLINPKLRPLPNVQASQSDDEAQVDSPTRARGYGKLDGQSSKAKVQAPAPPPPSDPVPSDILKKYSKKNALKLALSKTNEANEFSPNHQKRHTYGPLPSTKSAKKSSDVSETKTKSKFIGFTQKSTLQSTGQSTGQSKSPKLSPAARHQKSHSSISPKGLPGVGLPKVSSWSDDEDDDIDDDYDSYDGNDGNDEKSQMITKSQTFGVSLKSNHVINNSSTPSPKKRWPTVQGNNSFKHKNSDTNTKNGNNDNVIASQQTLGFGLNNPNAKVKIIKTNYDSDQNGNSNSNNNKGMSGKRRPPPRPPNRRSQGGSSAKPPGSLGVALDTTRSIARSVHGMDGFAQFIWRNGKIAAVDSQILLSKMKSESNSISVYSSTDAVLTTVKDNIRMSPWVRSIVVATASNFEDDAKFLQQLKEAGNKNEILIYDPDKQYNNNNIQSLSQFSNVTYAIKHNQVIEFVSNRVAGK